MPALFIPLDLNRPGGNGEHLQSGYTVLAQDEKGALVRLDSFAAGCITTALLFAARSRNDDGTPLLRAIRPASHADRYQRFRRPEHLDWLHHSCCGTPCRFMAIYDESSGRFFDLEVTAEQALQASNGPLFYTFGCAQCGCMHELPVQPAG